MSGFLYVWSGRAFESRGRCRRCQTLFRLHIRFDTGKRIPVRLDAKPLRTDTQVDTGKKYDVYNWSDVHRCPKKPD